MSFEIKHFKPRQIDNMLFILNKINNSEITMIATGFIFLSFLGALITFFQRLIGNLRGTLKVL